MFQLHYQTSRPLTTAHLAQTMTLLGLTIEELKQQIEKEVASNPALELVEERRCPACHRVLPAKGACPVCSQPQTAINDEPVVFVSPREDYWGEKEYNPDQGDSEELFTASVDDLPTFVLRQVAMELSGEDLKIAAFLLTQLDEDGLLTTSGLEVARYFHVPLARIENILKTIQRAEPVGVGACSTQEALLVQIDVLSENQNVPELARKIVLETMDLMSRRQYPEIAHHFKSSLRLVQEAVRFISENLNPFPARSHWGDVRQPGANNAQVFQKPDIVISHLNDEPENRLTVEIIMPIGGTLRVNPLFKDAIRSAADEQRDSWKSDFERASLFVKCLQQRNHTMQRLMTRVVSLQKPFILHGEKHLKPVTRAQIAHELEVHESTISRAVAGKTVQLPNRRIIPLSEFFDRSLSVRTLLKEIISGESKPLSDTELVELLGKEGIAVARRTVAKYRAMEGILPAHLRTPVTRGTRAV